jgi:hypothetical protein
LQLQRNSLDWSLLDSLHHVSCEPYKHSESEKIEFHSERDIGEQMPRILTSNLVSESLRLDDSDVVDDTLVGVEITSKSIIGS